MHFDHGLTYYLNLLPKPRPLRHQQCIAKPHYLCNAEHVYPSLLAELELGFRELNQWMVRKLRDLVLEAELVLQRGVAGDRKEDSEWEGKGQGLYGLLVVHGVAVHLLCTYNRNTPS